VTPLALKVYNTAICVLFTAYVAVLLLFIIPPIWAALLVLPCGRRPARLLRHGARLTLRLAGCRLRVRGLHHLTACGPAVVVANHASYLDSVILMAALPIDYLFVVNHLAAGWPFVGRTVKSVGHLVVDRTNGANRRACMAAMMDTLNQGSSLVVYPEGTRHRDGRLLPFQPGAFRTAIAAERPVIPVTICGSDRIWSTASLLLCRGPIDVIIHSPIASAEKGRLAVLRLSEAARGEILRAAPAPLT
jgi:1-acyl-sn-glycerol-3-phosphate acyltransferase